MFVIFEVLNFFRKESEELNKKLLIILIMSGFSNSTILASINAAAQHFENKLTISIFFITFFLSLAAYYFFQKKYLNSMNIIIENVIVNIREKLCRKVRSSDYYSIEQAGQAQLLTRITKDTNIIGKTMPLIISAVQSTTLLIFGMIYILYLSTYIFLLLVGILIIAVFIFIFYIRIGKQLYQTADISIVKMWGDVLHLFHGFKEVKLNSKRSEEIIDTISSSSKNVRDKCIEAMKMYYDNEIFIITVFLLMAGFVTFLFPVFVPMDKEILLKIVAALFFLREPLTLFLKAIPMTIQASVAINNIKILEDKLENISNKYQCEEFKLTERFQDFNKITLQNLKFRYKSIEDDKLFEAGPYNLTIKKGELIFIVGGNGSGKSTFLKMLSYLYYADAGSIKLDDEYITQANAQRYREMYSTVFSDFHLFDRLFGIQNIDEDEVNDLLVKMQINHKVSFEENKFSTKNLSTGQKKRLAFIIALLEDRPIYILDEWAAEQDPEFRNHYYTEILKELKEKGKTLLVVTHDDRYLHCADRILKMEFGKIEEI
ncbi:cyclic peptide export ABC transporter [Candidatus Dependentiae bacterium]|nr:cyclic peptide export ABC transporter [Candidatus Dependentiae bacterium]